MASWTYDVFLSFRGEDTRDNFTQDLYNALQGRGIKTFKDDERLNKGDEISGELRKAINESRFALIIFSTNYADSAWCLEELSLIMESLGNPEKKVIPVFVMDVDPSDVRYQNGSFGTPFGKLQQRHGSEKVERWRSALRGAADLSGWNLKDFHGDQQKLIHDIVEKVWKGLSLDWNKVNYDFSGVDWTKVDYDFSHVDWNNVFKV